MLGIIGGSGFSKFLENTTAQHLQTPFGNPSGPIMVGEYQGKSATRRIAFLPRHGLGHILPPHKINYRANLWAFKKLGVDKIFAPCAVGSLQPNIKPGDFLIIDQFVDRTYGRADTFYEGRDHCPPDCQHLGRVAHASPAEPYCPDLRQLAIASCQKLGITAHPRGTVVVINGPRYSTKSESRWFSQMGWEIINMTQYPEVMLAREMEMCFVGIALVTDYDVGLEGREDIKPVDSQMVLQIFKENNEKLTKLLLEMIANLPEEKKCACGQAMKNAFVS